MTVAFRYLSITSAIALCLLTAACATSVTLPVQGDFSKGKERFLGHATGNLDGTGTLTMTTESEVACKGDFKYDDTRVAGKGAFTCDDGRKGTFHFTSSGMSGIGFGKTTKGEAFRFAFGHSTIETKW
ncbi:MAG TPA: hypothetical protein VHP34_10410 [Alphaproteobacteria bacterium]|nr:hypothetical protein [Alphaproteobacteria bacterium]